jgi:hypothetical protein
MAIFCPTCGLENQPDRNFCRGCGTNLRVVKSALELSSAGDPQAETVLATKKHATDIILRKVGELQVKKAGDLKKIIEQLEILMESDEVRRVRHLRNALITIAGISAGICFFSLGFLEDAHAPPALMIGVSFIFLGIVVPTLLLMLHRLAKPLRQQGSPEIKLPEAGGDQIGPPQLAHQTPVSVTEHTTQQLGGLAYRPPQSEATPPK